MVNNKTQDLNFKNDIEELICQIDNKLIYYSKKELDVLRFGGFYNYKTTNNLKFFILTKYKKILLDKICNSECLKDYSMDSIISNIKEYLISDKLKRINNDSNNYLSSPVSFNRLSSSDKEFKYNMSICYNNYITS